MWQRSLSKNPQSERKRMKLDDNTADRCCIYYNIGRLCLSHKQTHHKVHKQSLRCLYYVNIVYENNDINIQYLRRTFVDDGLNE